MLHSIVKCFSRVESGLILQNCKKRLQNTKYSLYLYFSFHLYLDSCIVSSGRPPSRRVWVNFAELQKGCKIVLARRAPYLRVVTNDKYCTSYHSSCKRSPKPDQRLYSTTARVCLTVPHTSHRSFVLHIHRFKLLHLNVVETVSRSRFRFVASCKLLSHC